MPNFVSFVLVKNGGTGDVTVVPSSNSNGVAEWLSANSVSQAYRVTASVRRSSQNNRKYAIKLEVPKGTTQEIGGVQLPVSAIKPGLKFSTTMYFFKTTPWYRNRPTASLTCWKTQQIQAACQASPHNPKTPTGSNNTHCGKRKSPPGLATTKVTTRNTTPNSSHMMATNATVCGEW